MNSPPKTRLLETAAKLFHRNGIHATGVDMIMSEAGVARMTFYRHFPSKEDLVIAALEQCSEQRRQWLQKTVELKSKGKTPTERLLTVFEALEERLQSDAAIGCPLVKAAGEYPELTHPVHQLAAKHKALVVAYIESLTIEACVSEPKTLAQQLFLLMEGAISMALMTGSTEPAQTARTAAAVLLKTKL